MDGRAGPQTWKAIYDRVGAGSAGSGSPPSRPAPAFTQQVDERSERTIATLQPEVRPFARALVLKAAGVGITIKVISGLRSYEEQNNLYAQGRSRPGRIVTNARGGYSNHNFGIAFDVGVFERWDAEERNWKSKGWHAYRYLTVTRRGTYYYNRVDDKTLLAGFGTRVPAEFRRQPFFVGVAHTGYHVFPGFRGDVFEAHSTRRLDSFNNLEQSPFNPLASGGGPRWTSTERYRSGLIALPPQ